MVFRNEDEALRERVRRLEEQGRLLEVRVMDLEARLREAATRDRKSWPGVGFRHRERLLKLAFLLTLAVAVGGMAYALHWLVS